MSELRTNRIVPRDGLASGSYGGIVQVRYASDTNSQASESSTMADVSGASVTITPTRADNAILIMLTFNGNNAGGGGGRLMYQVVRTVGGSSSTIFSVGEALVDYGTSNIHVQGIGNNFIDTPSTTSAVTYKLQFASHNGTRVQVNNNGRTDLIVMEIAG